MSSPYSPLRRDPREIRLLDVEPWTSERTEPIRLHVFPTKLDAAGDYKCLSYTWVQPEPSFPVQLNGFGFRVRENLHEALLRLRPQAPHKPLRFWIDAICINQDDVEEREFQVSMMRDVYRLATDVIAWIGEENGPGDKVAVDFVEEMVERIKPWRLDSHYLTSDIVDWIRSVTADGIENSRWLRLLDLISRSWFSRVWIIQEVVMGEKVVVHCGSQQLEWWKLLLTSLFFIGNYQWIISMPSPDITTLGYPKFSEKRRGLVRLCAAAKQIAKVGSLLAFKDIGDSPSVPKDTQSVPMRRTVYKTLYDVLCYFRTFKASDERDRVYALLGLAEGLENIPRPLPTVSYQKGVDLVDILLTVHTNDLKGGGNLDFLSLEYGGCGLGKFPSWIPRLKFFDSDELI